MSEKENVMTEEEIFDEASEEMSVTLYFDDDEIECNVVTIFDYDGKEYIALLPLDENGDNEDGEVWIYGYSENPDNPDEEPELRNLSDEELEKAGAEFDRLVQNSEHDEII